MRADTPLLQESVYPWRSARACSDWTQYSDLVSGNCDPWGSWVRKLQMSRLEPAALQGYSLGKDGEPTLTTYAAQYRINLASSLLKKRPHFKISIFHQRGKAFLDRLRYRLLYCSCQLYRSSWVSLLSLDSEDCNQDSGISPVHKQFLLSLSQNSCGDRALVTLSGHW